MAPTIDILGTELKVVVPFAEVRAASDSATTGTGWHVQKAALSGNDRQACGVSYNPLIDCTGPNNTVKECNQCGKCCTRYSDGGLSASASEIDWWENFRPEIFNYVSGGKIWISPATGKQMVRCPWLRKLPHQNKYVCRIYYDRPEDCKHYPVSIDQMVRDGCEMLEARDLARPKQAQRTLDELMADSRPPCDKAGTA